jgi:phosphatidylserine decarboxylase
MALAKRVAPHHYRRPISPLASTVSTPFLHLLRALPFYLLPHHLVSWLTYGLARASWPPLKNRLIDLYMRVQPVNLAEAEISDPHAYPTLNAFFTRALHREARPLAPGEDTAVCPVDGRVSQAGVINGGRVFQAKGREYSLLELVGGDGRLAQPFTNGRFATLYLSPRDYHRIHMPLGGRLTDMIYVPGRLFSVAPYTVDTIPRLFARNERVVCRFETAHGPMVMVLVGAINVSAIDTVWHGPVTPPSRGRIEHWRYDESMPVELSRGAEMGRFNLGSTVIVLFGEDCELDPAIVPAAPVRLGQALARPRP